MRESVLSQCSPLLEGFSADRTLVRVFVCMDFHVGFQPGVVGKFLFAHLTLIRFLAFVGTFVYLELVVSCIFLATYITGVSVKVGMSSFLMFICRKKHV